MPDICEQRYFVDDFFGSFLLCTKLRYYSKDFPIKILDFVKIRPQYAIKRGYLKSSILDMSFFT